MRETCPGKVFISNLSAAIPEASLKTLVKKYGVVLDCKKTTTSAYVTFRDQASAELACSGLNGKTFSQSLLRVQLCKERTAINASSQECVVPSVGKSVPSVSKSVPSVSKSAPSVVKTTGRPKDVLSRGTYQQGFRGDNNDDKAGDHEALEFQDNHEAMLLSESPLSVCASIGSDHNDEDFSDYSDVDLTLGEDQSDVTSAIEQLAETSRASEPKIAVECPEESHKSLSRMEHVGSLEAPQHVPDTQLPASPVMQKRLEFLQSTNALGNNDSGDARLSRARSRSRRGSPNSRRGSSSRDVTRVYVGNLTQDATIESLHNLMGEFGKMTKCVMKKSYGYVVFRSPSSANRAREALAATTIGGRTLHSRNRKRRRTQPQTPESSGSDANVGRGKCTRELAALGGVQRQVASHDIPQPIASDGILRPRSSGSHSSLSVDSGILATRASGSADSIVLSPRSDELPRDMSGCRPCGSPSSSYQTSRGNASRNVSEDENTLTDTEYKTELRGNNLTIIKKAPPCNYQTVLRGTSMTIRKVQKSTEEKENSSAENVERQNDSENITERREGAHDEAHSNYEVTMRETGMTLKKVVSSRPQQASPNVEPMEAVEAEEVLKPKVRSKNHARIESSDEDEERDLSSGKSKSHTSNDANESVEEDQSDGEAPVNRMFTASPAGEPADEVYEEDQRDSDLALRYGHIVKDARICLKRLSARTIARYARSRTEVTATRQVSEKITERVTELVTEEEKERQEFVTRAATIPPLMKMPASRIEDVCSGSSKHLENDLRSPTKPIHAGKANPFPSLTANISPAFVKPAQFVKPKSLRGNKPRVKVTKKRFSSPKRPASTLSSPPSNKAVNLKQFKQTMVGQNRCQVAKLKRPRAKVASASGIELYSRVHSNVHTGGVKGLAPMSEVLAEYLQVPGEETAQENRLSEFDGAGPFIASETPVIPIAGGSKAHLGNVNESTRDSLSGRVPSPTASGPGVIMDHWLSRYLENNLDEGGSEMEPGERQDNQSLPKKRKHSTKHNKSAEKNSDKVPRKKKKTTQLSCRDSAKYSQATEHPTELMLSKSPAEEPRKKKKKRTENQTHSTISPALSSMNNCVQWCFAQGQQMGFASRITTQLSCRDSAKYSQATEHPTELMPSKPPAKKPWEKKKKHTGNQTHSTISPAKLPKKKLQLSSTKGQLRSLAPRIPIPESEPAISSSAGVTSPTRPNAANLKLVPASLSDTILKPIVNPAVPTNIPVNNTLHSDTPASFKCHSILRLCYFAAFEDHIASVLRDDILYLLAVEVKMKLNVHVPRRHLLAPTQDEYEAFKIIRPALPVTRSKIVNLITVKKLLSSVSTNASSGASADGNGNNSDPEYVVRGVPWGRILSDRSIMAAIQGIRESLSPKNVSPAVSVCEGRSSGGQVGPTTAVSMPCHERDVATLNGPKQEWPVSTSCGPVTERPVSASCGSGLMSPPCITTDCSLKSVPPPAGMGRASPDGTPTNAQNTVVRDKSNNDELKARPGLITSTATCTSGDLSTHSHVEQHKVMNNSPTEQQGQSRVQQGQPTAKQGQPTRKQGQSTEQQGQSTEQQGQPPKKQGQPTAQQGQPTKKLSQPTLQPGQPTKKQGQSTLQQVQPTKKQGQPTLQQCQPPKKQGQPTEPQGQPPKKQGQSTLLQGQPTKKQGQSTLQQGQPPKKQGQPTLQQGQTTKKQGQSALQQGQPPKKQCQSTEQQCQPPKKQGQPTEPQGQPPRKQGQPPILVDVAPGLVKHGGECILPQDPVSPAAASPASTVSAVESPTVQDSAQALCELGKVSTQSQGHAHVSSAHQNNHSETLEVRNGTPVVAGATSRVPGPMVVAPSQGSTAVSKSSRTAPAPSLSSAVLNHGHSVVPKPTRVLGPVSPSPSLSDIVLTSGAGPLASLTRPANSSLPKPSSTAPKCVASTPVTPKCPPKPVTPVIATPTLTKTPHQLAFTVDRIPVVTLSKPNVASALVHPVNTELQCGYTVVVNTSKIISWVGPAPNSAAPNAASPMPAVNLSIAQPISSGPLTPASPSMPLVRVPVPLIPVPSIRASFSVPLLPSPVRPPSVSVGSPQVLQPISQVPGPLVNAPTQAPAAGTSYSMTASNQLSKMVHKSRKQDLSNPVAQQRGSAASIQSSHGMPVSTILYETTPASSQRLSGLTSTACYMWLLPPPGQRLQVQTLPSTHAAPVHRPGSTLSVTNSVQPNYPHQGS